MLWDDLKEVMFRRWYPILPKIQAPSPMLCKQRRGVPAGTNSRLLVSTRVTLHNFKVQELSSPRRKTRHWLWSWFLSDSPGSCSMLCTQDLWLQAPQHSTWGNARWMVRMFSHWNATALRKTQLMLASLFYSFPVTIHQWLSMEHLPR